MSRYYRKIDLGTRKYWNNLGSKKADYIRDEDFSPTLMQGWLEERPSIWKIIDNQSPTKDEIFYAVYEGLDAKENILFLHFDESVISNAKLELAKTEGNTGREKIDQSGAHFDIHPFSALRLFSLIYEILKSDYGCEEYKKSSYQQERSKIVNRYDKSYNQVQSSTQLDANLSIPVATASTNIEPQVPKSIDSEKIVTTSATTENPDIASMPSSSSSVPIKQE